MGLPACHTTGLEVRKLLLFWQIHMNPCKDICTYIFFCRCLLNLNGNPLLGGLLGGSGIGGLLGGGGGAPGGGTGIVGGILGR